MSVSIYHRNDSNMDLRLDEASATTMYLGLAAIDSNAASPVWQIRQFDTTTGIIVRWADGNSNFDNVWNDRATITYTRGP